jgi:ribonucleoside-diphosphate reductase alpha chain
MFKQTISFDTWGGENGKYRLKNRLNESLEDTPEDTCKRVSNALADSEESDKKAYWNDQFNSIMGTKFAGGGRIMANAGATEHKKETSPINCTVMRQIPDSMIGIMDVAKESALTLKAGCGVGYDFSPIRPKGAHVFGAGAATSGIISFMKIFDAVCSTVMSGGARRGAQMACLDISSPDIEEFITAKRQDGVLRYFNCSVLITDKFMETVENDGNWDLWFWEKIYDKIDESDLKIKLIRKDDIPYSHSDFTYFRYDKNHNEVVYGNCTTKDIFIKKVYKTVKAKYLFDLITKSTYNFWEPGFILIDRVNKENNLYFCETIRCTNPCVSGDTRLATQYGLMTVKELYEKQLPIMATVDNRAFGDSFGVSTKPAKPVFMTAESASIYKVSTNHGYEIKATEWHEFYTQRGKIKLKDMVVGDTLYIQSGKGQFGDKGNYELGSIIGWITGDGHFSNDGNHPVAHLTYWNKDRELANNMVNWVNNIVLKEKHNGKENRTYQSSITNQPDQNKSTIQSRILARYLDTNFNFNTETKLRVPEIIWQGNEECVRGYLKHLFQADGTVNIRNTRAKKEFNIRLASSYKELLNDVQMLLSNFGIVSHIYKRRNERYVDMPNGKGGSKPYLCKIQYELLIMGESKNVFFKEIGFFGAKQSRLNEYIEICGKSRKKEKFKTKITDIQFAGNEPVYDTTQPEKNAVIFNSLHTGQCGEQPLHPLTSCLLGSMILPPYVSNGFEKNASFDFDQLAKDVRIATRALDNVVEINNLPLKEMQEEILSKRRHGLGFTGLGSTLNMLCVSYGSDESLEFSEKVMLIIAQQGLLENISLAKEKGCAPIFSTEKNRKLVLESIYLKRLLNTFDNKDELIQDILQYGLRFSHATSIAPTGTMSMSWGNNCSNGIEPVFANSYMRNVRSFGKKTKTQEEVFDYAFFLWKEKFVNKALPKYWKTTDDLKVMDHLKIQSVVQKWCDSSISKTINIPENYSFEDFQKVYLDGWKLGLKGLTTYRPNPNVSSGVLTQKETLEKTEYCFKLEDGTEVSFKGTDSVEYDGEIHNVANLFDALKEGIYGNM